MKTIRILAGICALTMTCSGMLSTAPDTGFSLTACAAESGQLGDNLTWTLSDRNVLTISGTGDWQDGEKIPAEILQCTDSVIIKNGVTSIGKSAFGTSVYGAGYCISSVSIPDTVTSIGDRAFEGCQLESLTIPDSVKTIGAIAFCACRRLSSVTLPASVESIGNYAFCACDNLKTFTILNPECEIYDNQVTVSNEDEYCPCEGPRYRGTISGYEGSTAQAYAEKYGYTFEEIDRRNPDFDGDGSVTVCDAQYVLLAYSDILVGKQPDLNQDQMEEADVNRDGKITAADAQYIALYFLYNTVLEKSVTWREIIC